MKISTEDIKSALEKTGYRYDHTSKGGFIVKINGNNGEVISTVISVDESEPDCVVFASFIPVKISKESHSRALDLINLVHSKAIWFFRYTLDINDGEIATFATYVSTSGRILQDDFERHFYACVLAADRIYPCMMAVNFGGKESKEAYETHYFKKKSA